MFIVAKYKPENALNFLLRSHPDETQTKHCYYDVTLTQQQPAKFKLQFPF
jgi:hypothetical protein